MISLLPENSWGGEVEKDADTCSLGNGCWDVWQWHKDVPGEEEAEHEEKFNCEGEFTVKVVKHWNKISRKAFR